MEPISDKTETGKEDLTVEEMKAMRLCPCGNYKPAVHNCCGQCFLLLAEDQSIDPEQLKHFTDELKMVIAGEKEYKILIPMVKPERISVLMERLMAKKVFLDDEHYQIGIRGVTKYRLRKEASTARDRKWTYFKIKTGSPHVISGNSR